MRLKDIYENIKNPLDDSAIKYLYDNYGYVDTYNLVIGSNTKPNTTYDNNQRDSYNKLLFNIWRNSILNLSEERIEKLEQRYNYKNIRRIRSVLTEPLYKYYDLESTEGIYRCLVSECMDLAYFCLPENLRNNKFKHTVSDKIDLTEDEYFLNHPINHRLYVNIDNKNVYKLAEKVVEKCSEKELPFYFKFEDNSNRKDSFVLYTDTRNLTNYMECLDEVFEENKDLQMSTYSPLMFAGQISPYYSIGDQPIQNTNLHSFNTLRANCIDNAMTNTIRRWMYENQNTKLKRKGEVLEFKEYLTDKVIELLARDIYGEQKHKNYYNLDDSVFLGKNINNLKKALYSSVDKYVNGKNSELIQIHEDKHLNPLKYKSPKFFGVVSPSIINEVIKEELGSKIIHKFSDSSQYFKYYLKEELRKNKVDIEKPCFNIDTKEKFENTIYRYGR